MLIINNHEDDVIVIQSRSALWQVLLALIIMSMVMRLTKIIHNDYDYIDYNDGDEVFFTYEYVFIFDISVHDTHGVAG